MTKIINGKRYSTESAKTIGAYSNNLSSRDFHSLDETLYKTGSGNYFLHGEGGPMTDYAVCEGNTTYGGCRIIPMTRADAFRWAQEKLDFSEVESEFADLISEA